MLSFVLWMMLPVLAGDLPKNAQMDPCLEIQKYPGSENEKQIQRCKKAKTPKKKKKVVKDLKEGHP